MSASAYLPLSLARSTALFRPAKLKCGSAVPTRGRGSGTARGSPDSRRPLHRRAAGEAEPEQFRGLVEGFAGGIVDRGGETPVAADPRDQQQLAMAARDEQQEIRESKLGIGQHRRKRVAFQMVDRDQRLAGRQREPLCSDQPHHHAADQPGARSCGDRVDLGQLDLRLRKHLLDQLGKDLDMGAGGDLGDHAAIGPVRDLLPRQFVRENPPVRGDQGHRCLVAAGFDAEDQAHLCFPAISGAASSSAA